MEEITVSRIVAKNMLAKYSLGYIKVIELALAALLDRKKKVGVRLSFRVKLVKEIRLEYNLSFPALKTSFEFVIY